MPLRRPSVLAGSPSGPPDFSSSLTPPPIHKNSSFFRIARVLGIRTAHNEANAAGKRDKEDDDGDDECDGEESSPDEETLLWDAQTALIAHRPSLAIQHYTAAALAPHRSSAACLALGNLLLRGSALSPNEYDCDPKGKGKARSGSSAVSPTSPAVTDETSTALHHGKDFSRSASSPTVQISPRSAAQRVYSYLWNMASPPSTPLIGPLTNDHQSILSPTSTSERRAYDLVASGWGIPREGKRAVRDVEGMGVAGGWLVLGIGWIVERELERERIKHSRHANEGSRGKRDESMKTDEGTFVRDPQDDDGVLVFGKTKRNPHPAQTKHRRSPILAARFGANAKSTSPVEPSSKQSSRAMSRNASTVDISLPENATGSGVGSASGSGTRTESTMINTPANEGGPKRADDLGGKEEEGREEKQEEDDLAVEEEEQTMTLLYDLLQPLLHLYRNGHIQLHDPVALPPIASSQLPSVLRPQGDAEKARNVWKLGGVVARKLLRLVIMQSQVKGGDEAHAGSNGSGEFDRRRAAVEIMAEYVIGMTAPEDEAADHFRSIMNLRLSGFEFPDDLIRQAAKRLDLIQRTPGESLSISKANIHAGAQAEYPFPRMKPLKPPTRSGSSAAPKRIATAPVEMGSVHSMFSTVRPNGHGRLTSTASFQSNFSASRILSTPVKSSASLASLAMELDPVEAQPSTKVEGSESDVSALSLLRRLRADSDAVEANERAEWAAERAEASSSSARWPSLAGWTLGSRSPPASAEALAPLSTPQHNGVLTGSHDSEATTMRIKMPLDLHAPDCYEDLPPHLVPPVLRTIASSPQFPTHPPFSPPASNRSTPRRRLPFEPEGLDKIASIDPALAAAEMASALTKHVVCSVCGAEGVNFPECRKCRLTFCSRVCRVDAKRAGDGKRHVCGAWESRRLLTVPVAVTKPKRLSSGASGAAAMPGVRAC